MPKKSKKRLSFTCSTTSYDSKELQAFLMSCGGTYLDCSEGRAIEFLRSSPKRRQSVSPERIGTPSNNGPKERKQRTPRKDTPKKRKKPIFRCRNTGCSVILACSKSRDRHEKQSCPHGHVLDPVTSTSPQFAVPSHSELNVDPLVCRFPNCSKQYKNVHARKKHEQEKHRLLEIHGRTVSPVAFPSESPTLRPTSCPPPPSRALSSTPSNRSVRRRHLSFSDNSTFDDQSMIPSPSLSITGSSMSPSEFVTIISDSEQSDVSAICC